MEIPGYVTELMVQLNTAGFQAWTVGGCVRDSLLGQTPKDWDLCTDARPEQTLSLFASRRLLTQGLKHGTVTVLSEAPVEITTFRAEGDYQDNRHPGWVKFVPDIQADLARRDFTVNAIAYCPALGFADPFGGRADLRARILRAVGEPAARFQEDSLRILRGARFSAAYGLIPEPETYSAMLKLRGLLDGLAKERVYSELCKLLLAADAASMRRWAPILAQTIPELAPMMGFQQRNPHHSFDVFDHTAHVVQATPADLTLRWAALLHDVGKPRCFVTDAKGIGHFYGHAQAGAEMAAEILNRLRAPKALTAQAATLIRYHGSCRDYCAQEKTIRRLLGKLGEPTLRKLWQLDRADSLGKHPLPPGADYETQPFPPELLVFSQTLDGILRNPPCFSLKDLAVNGHDLKKIGIAPGPEMGRILRALLERTAYGSLPNEKGALLAAVPQIQNGWPTENRQA